MKVSSVSELTTADRVVGRINFGAAYGRDPALCAASSRTLASIRSAIAQDKTRTPRTPLQQAVNRLAQLLLDTGGPGMSEAAYGQLLTVMEHAGMPDDAQVVRDSTDGEDNEFFVEQGGLDCIQGV